MNPEDPLYKAALGRLAKYDPNFINIAKSDLKAFAVYGNNFDCVMFLNIGTVIIEGKDKEYCFHKGTLDFALEI